MYYVGFVEMAEDAWLEEYAEIEETKKKWGIDIEDMTWPWYYLLLAAIAGEI